MPGPEPSMPALRRFPFPYRAMLTICSDLDGSPDGSSYLNLCRFLNTTESGAWGPGAGLEIGNTIYFDNHPNRFAYWTGSDAEREAVRALIRSGHIDAIHSIGETAFTRADAERAFEELKAHDLTIRVWVNHGRTPTNFTSPNMPGDADKPNSAAYHADLAFERGLTYLWLGKVTNQIGVDCPRRYPRAPSLTELPKRLRATTKDLAKRFLGMVGRDDYSMHASNHLVRPHKLADGRSATEFFRCNPHWDGIGYDRGTDLDQILHERVIDDLIEIGGTSVIYTHFLKNAPAGELPEPAKRALRAIGVRQANGELLTTTTERLLDYSVARDAARLTSSRREDGGTDIHVTIDPKLPARASQGLTIYCDDPNRARVDVNGVEIDGLEANPADETGKPSVSIPWVPLQYPI